MQIYKIHVIQNLAKYSVAISKAFKSLLLKTQMDKIRDSATSHEEVPTGRMEKSAHSK